MSIEHPVVAFLQNCWFRPGTPDAIIRSYLTDQSYRRKVLAKTMTGHRLLTAFGEDAYRRIWWDNASEFVADHPSGRGDGDPAHVISVLQRTKPIAIMCFGRIAAETVERAQDALKVIAEPDGTLEQRCLGFMPAHYFPHPNARGLTQFQLSEFARQIISRYL